MSNLLFKKQEKGVSIYLAVLVTGVLLALGLGLATIIFREIKTITAMENSLQALYAADTGAEQMLYQVDQMPACPNPEEPGASSCGTDAQCKNGTCVPKSDCYIECTSGGGRSLTCPFNTFTCPLNGSYYKVNYYIPGSTNYSCGSNQAFCVKSEGSFKGTRRAIELNIPQS